MHRTVETVGFLERSVTDGALDGVTRNAVIEIARNLSIPCTEQRLAPYDLFTADECFLTGTGAELIPVREIAGRPMGDPDRPVYARLQRGFAELVAAETQKEPVVRMEAALEV